ncbi:MAG: type II toxin-antitoxin system HicB family antitoxin [Thermoanaerobaculia bacterium]|jgi:predicted RNase H-like HicB family nuclease
MSVELTAVFQQVPEGFIAFVEELPGANSQGATLDEARSNLHEAVTLVLEANRALSEQALANASVIRERFKLTA